VVDNTNILRKKRHTTPYYPCGTREKPGRLSHWVKLTEMKEMKEMKDSQGPEEF
jgi:hypothetical protein